MIAAALIIIAAFAATVVVSLASAIGIGWFIAHSPPDPPRLTDEWDDE